MFKGFMVILFFYSTKKKDENTLELKKKTILQG